MSEEFPVAHVGNDPDDSLGAGGVGHELGIHKSDVGENLLVGEEGDAKGGEHVGPEAFEDVVGKLIEFILGFFVSIGGAEIPNDNSSDIGKEAVSDSAEEFSQRKDGGQTEQAECFLGRAKYEVFEAMRDKNARRFCHGLRER